MSENLRVEAWAASCGVCSKHLPKTCHYNYSNPKEFCTWLGAEIYQDDGRKQDF